MENHPNKYTNSSSRDYFFEWITGIYCPSCIVYSSLNAKNVIYKNNLSPAEFLRPFGNFIGTSLNFSFADRFTINLKNLRFDFFDSEKFSKFNFSNFNAIVQNLMTHPQNYPEWNLNSLNQMSHFSKSNQEYIFRKMKNFSFPWFNEYEKTFFEVSNFSEFEMYQQPFANIFVISLKDDPKEIYNLQVKKITPLLIEEGIYEKNVPSMVLVLNDKSITGEDNSNETIFKCIEKIKKYFPSCYVICCDINSNKEETNSYDDIWSKYFHKLDFYRTENNHYAFSETKFGEFISLEDRESFKSAILKFFNEYIKVYLQKLVIDLDDEITNTKKGIKNGFFSIFKKGEKIEYVNTFNIYKLTTMEKKLYLLSLIQFYFRDYENAMEHLKIIMNDIRSKSAEHYNAVLEMYTVCHFMCALGQKKEVDIEAPYNNYLKSKNIKGAFRCLLQQVRMLEHLKRFNEISKLLIKATSELNLPCITPLLLEKSSIYHLINAPQLKKFILFQILAGIAYKNQSPELKRYTLNCFGNTIRYFIKNSSSFLRSKEFLNSNMGDICMNVEYFEGALKFFKNCIELSIYKKIDQDQALYIRHFLKSLNSLGQGKGLTYVQINEFGIPEIVNSSLIVVEEQDYEIGAIRLLTKQSHNWGNFVKYTKVELVRSYINLSKNDELILKNLDNIIENKQNFSNFHSKRIFKANVGNKIYVKFLVRNPLNLNLSISSIKLLCDFIVDKNYEINQDEVLIETEEKSLLLEKNSSVMITLSCVPKTPGRVIIHGLEVGLYKIALFKHSFYKKDVSKLHNYRERSKSTSSHSSSNSNPLIKQFSHHEEIPNNTKEICFDIIDDNQDIKILFPKGKEINLFQNELLLMPVIIKNNANFKIKRFCLFADDSEMYISKHSSLKSENNVCLSDYIFKEIYLPSDTQDEIVVPICPQKSGEFYLKILLKFEEEMKMKEIDIKRFIIKFNVSPSVKFNINEEVLFYDAISTVLKIEINVVIENKDQLSMIKIYQTYYDSTYHLHMDDLQENEWKILECENNYKIYSKLKLTKDKKRNKTLNKLDSLVKYNKNKIDESIDSLSTAVSPEKFEFLPEEISTTQPQVSQCLNKILSQDKMFFNWTAKNRNDEIINAIYIYDCKMKIPSINKSFLKTVFRNSIEVDVIQTALENSSLVTINFKLKKNNIREITEIQSYEIFVSDEENDFTWMGTSKYKIDNSSISNYNDLELKFNLLTDKKGIVEVNKFNLKVNPKNLNEKTFSITNIPKTIIFEVV